MLALADSSFSHLIVPAMQETSAIMITRLSDGAASLQFRQAVASAAAGAPSSPGEMLRGWSREASSDDDDFDADAATRAAKKLRVEALRAALEAAGADSKGLKPALVERLVGVRRQAAASGPTLSPVAFSETDEAEPPSPAKKRVWGLRRRFSPRKLRTRRPQPSQ